MTVSGGMAPSGTEPARRLELASALLLAVAAVATAWAAYQARQWTGEQSQAYSRGTAARIAENRAAALAGRQEQIDIATFIQWLDARAQRRPALARFYRVRFRPEFQPAFTAWLSSRPFTNRRAPQTPFALPQYRLAAAAQAQRLERSAAAASARAAAANTHADNYMLAVVLLATSLFFAGISMKLQNMRIRAAVLGLGGVICVAALIWMVTLPVHLAA